MRRLVVLVILLAGCSTVGEQVRMSPEVRCEEDQACWDCATMGNRICGTAEQAVELTYEQWVDSLPVY